MGNLMFARYENVELRIGKSARKFKPCMLRINTPVMVLSDQPLTDKTLYVRVLTPRGVGWIDAVDICGVNYTY